MNTGIQDAVSLAPALLDVLHGGDEAGLDAWAQSRHQVAKRVVGLTDKMTRAAGVTSPVGRQLRNAAISFVSHVPAAREALAREIAELRSEEHTSELQSLMRTSYAVFCL